MTVLEPPVRPASLHRRRAVGLAIVLGALVGAVVASIAVGANPLSMDAVWRALVQPDDGEASIVVWTLRIPRTVVGILTGAAFGAAGAIIQALTRNPLADPGILGVNAGAGFAITIGVAFFGVSAVSGYVWFAFLGAAAATVIVYLIGSAGRGTASPVALVLAGVALAAVLGGLSTLIQLVNPETFRVLRRWGLGSIAQTPLDDTLTVVPFLLVGLVLAVVLSGSLNAIALGDDLAVSLGTRIVRTRVLSILAVTLLAGGATALTGGIAFVGLMVPHIVRWFTGPDQRWIIAYSILCAPVLLLVADVLGRIIARPNEIEVGIVTAVVGAPMLIALVRSRRASAL